MGVVIAHVAGIPFEELLLAAMGGGGLWTATRVYVAQRRRRTR